MPKERDTEVMRLNLVTREIIDTAKAYAVTSTVKRNTAAENRLEPEKYSAAAVMGVVSSEAYRLHSSMTIAYEQTATGTNASDARKSRE